MKNAFYFILKALFVLKGGNYSIHLFEFDFLKSTSYVRNVITENLTNTFMGKCAFLEHMYG